MLSSRISEPSFTSLQHVSNTWIRLQLIRCDTEEEDHRRFQCIVEVEVNNTLDLSEDVVVINNDMPLDPNRLVLNLTKDVDILEGPEFLEVFVDIDDGDGENVVYKHQVVLSVNDCNWLRDYRISINLRIGRCLCNLAFQVG
ncbi:hypothetical protein GJ496_002623 [Pomphorhynchus laevis]|nr:hypothetical protein GJ496_002623 [Pomphorhynchus laevis]